MKSAFPQTAGVLAALFLCLTAGASGTDDALVAFSTKGPDRYADGSVVLDGEAYALVWSKDGVFDGFTADGKPSDPNDQVVLVAALARGGRCPDVLFQISTERADALKDGVCALYLLDTRVTAKTRAGAMPKGAVGGTIETLNGYGEVASSVKVSGTSHVKVVEGAGDGEGQVASVTAAAPANCDQPKIKGLRIDGENVVLTVENLKGYMRVQGGDDVKASQTTGAATQTSGTGADVILVAPKLGTRGFYRVIRN